MTEKYFFQTRDLMMKKIWQSISIQYLCETRHGLTSDREVPDHIQIITLQILFSVSIQQVNSSDLWETSMQKCLCGKVILLKCGFLSSSFPQQVIHGKRGVMNRGDFDPMMPFPFHLSVTPPQQDSISNSTKTKGTQCPHCTRHTQEM